MFGDHIRLGTHDHLFAHADGYKYTIPLGALWGSLLEQLLVSPKVLYYRESMWGPPQPSRSSTMRTGAYSVAPTLDDDVD